MKKIISLILCLSLLSFPCAASAKTNKDNNNEPFYVEKIYNSISDISETIMDNKTELSIYRIDVVENQFKVSYTITTDLSKSTKTIITPYAWLSYPKTTKAFNPVYNQFALTIPYSEYSNLFEGTFSGTLSLVSVVKVSGGWEATYSGTLYGSGHM